MKLAIIGIGNMGQALVEGFLKKEASLPGEIYLYDYETKKASDFASKTGCNVCSVASEAVKDADVVLLAVKPQVMKVVIDGIKGVIRKDVLVLSIAAGISINTLKSSFESDDISIVRIMPNTPALVGEGASALCFYNLSDKQQEYCMKLFETCGIAVRVEEKVMDAVTGLSGSGPAYAMIFIEAMADAGVKMGLTRDVAIKLAAMTLKGAATMVLETGKHPAELKDQVCSPGGTTIAAVHALEKGGFRGAVMDAVCASAQKSKELAAENK